MRKTTQLYGLATAITCLLLAGCKKFVSIAPPAVQTEQSKIFTSNEGAVSALSGLYSSLQSSSFLITNGGATLYPALSADELMTNNSGSHFKQFQTNTLVANSEEGIKGKMWQPAYRAIYQCNAIVEGLDASASVSNEVRNQVKGETLVIRSLLYCYLVNFFGDVPLVITTGYLDNQKMKRTARDEIYKQLIKDLELAVSLLPAVYPSAQKVRANKWTAAALLARLYLYTGDWSKSDAAATEVIISGAYMIETNLDNVFVSGSREAIWQLMLEQGNTAEGSAFVPYSATSLPNYVVTDNLINAFETGDKRKTHWLGTSDYNGQTYHYPYKYKMRELPFGGMPTEYNTVVRLAEQYLIRAEARTKQHQLAGAVSDINILRTRAGLPPYAGSDANEVLTAIALERQRELFIEWGHRWIDLKRTGKSETVLSPIKTPDWQSTDILYPLPQSELNVNPFLTQNPGY